MKQLLDLADDECRYALNDGGPFLFCAEPKQEKSSYCPHHHNICTHRVPIVVRRIEVNAA